MGMMGVQELVGTIKRHRRIHRVARKARFAVGHLIPPRRFAEIPGRVHFNDFMFLNSSPAEVKSYAQRARNVMDLIEEALSEAGRTFEDVERWLDFGCGYGRVVRFLVGRVPAERVFASDVISEGVDFCAAEFGLHPVYSQAELDRVSLGSFDFIYAVSVITHLNERNSTAFLRLVGESLTEGGVALFTTHGRWSIENAGLYGFEYEARQSEIAALVQERGIAYLPYEFVGDDYGMTWHSREYIEAKMAELHGRRVAPLMFRPHALDGHQDVHAFQRVRSSSGSRTA
jgi:SAM-dependent methyltransferase